MRQVFLGPEVCGNFRGGTVDVWGRYRPNNIAPLTAGISEPGGWAQSLVTSARPSP